MTLNRPSRSSVRATMAPTDTEAAGSPAKRPETPPETDWSVSIPRRARGDIWWWEVLAQFRHLFGRHSFVDREVWTTSWIDGTADTVVTIDGQDCWLCPARR